MAGHLVERVRFRPAAEIEHKVAADEVFGHAVQLPGFQGFLDGLPSTLGAQDLKDLVAAMRQARADGRPILWAMGAHAVKCGLTPWLTALAREGFMTALALNGAAVIHDLELALIGETSEDVAAHLGDGAFGTADEPGRLLGEALRTGGRRGFGAIAAEVLASDCMPRRDRSLLAALRQCDVPVTVHAALGTDTIHFHPSVDWSLLGGALQRDFTTYVDLVAELDGGGVYLNVGSAVLLPEVFLKAVTVIRNGGRRLEGFTTANLDMIQHYRPRENVLRRPGGRAIALTGHHEIMIPLIGCALLSGERPIPEGGSTS